MLKHDYIDSRHLLAKDLDRNENLESNNGDVNSESVYETIVIDTCIVVNDESEWIVGSAGCGVEVWALGDDILDIADLESVSSLPGVVLHGLAFVVLRLLAELEDLLGELLVLRRELLDQLLVLDEFLLLGLGGGIGGLDLLLAAALLALDAEEVSASARILNMLASKKVVKKSFTMAMTSYLKIVDHYVLLTVSSSWVSFSFAANSGFMLTRRLPFFSTSSLRCLIMSWTWASNSRGFRVWSICMMAMKS